MSLSAVSQNRPDLDALKTIFGISDTSLNISILPFEALSGNYDILIEGLHIGESKTGNKRGYKVIWPSPLIYGTNVLFINPKQIYLRTEHENPYPNYLYWIININPDQYKLIAKNLESRLAIDMTDKTTAYSYYRTFLYNDIIEEEPMPYDWTYKEILAHKKDYKKKLYLNFINILKSLNKILKSNDLSILLPSFKEFCAVKPIRTLYSSEEYNDEFNSIEYKSGNK
jgi:hypothetical protein